MRLLLEETRDRLVAEEEDITWRDIEFCAHRRPTLILFNARQKRDPAWSELYRRARGSRAGDPSVNRCTARTPTLTCRSERSRLDPPLGTQWTIAVI